VWIISFNKNSQQLGFLSVLCGTVQFGRSGNGRLSTLDVETVQVLRLLDRRKWIENKCSTIGACTYKQSEGKRWLWHQRAWERREK